MLRTHNCGELRAADAGKTVKLAGWVHAVRAFGKITFVDLRDRYGITQVVFLGDLAKIAAKLNREDVIAVEGVVQKRKKPNPALETGEIEVVAKELQVLNKADALPLELFNPEVKTDEETALRYRYLWLRRPEMQRVLEFRFKAELIARNYLASMGFIEVETPYLSKPTPEGARDFLVPSRKYPGKFWALPQSPQQYKQLLMVAGIDRYFQFARCFRDEDLRADRQYEFTQLDIEMSFVEEKDVQKVVEGILRVLYAQLFGRVLPQSFPALRWADAMDTYGIDKPYPGVDPELIDISKEYLGKKPKLWGNRKLGKTAKLLPVNRIIEEKEVKKVIGGFKKTELPAEVTWAVFKNGAAVSGPGKRELRDYFTDDSFTGTVFMAAGEWEPTVTFLGKLARKLRPPAVSGPLSILWITDFPMFEVKPEEGLQAVHHPFTAVEDEKQLFEAETLDELLKIKGRSYDLVMNGIEVGGGSIRNHRLEAQLRIFEILGIPEKEAWKKFRMLLEALKYGAPPHGGFAFGFDRLLQVMLKKESIRDVIAFPKDRKGRALMEDAPSEADPEALKELGIEVKRH